MGEVLYRSWCGQNLVGEWPVKSCLPDRGTHRVYQYLFRRDGQPPSFGVARDPFPNGFPNQADLPLTVYVAQYNRRPKPFIWTAKACDILQNVTRADRTLDKVQAL